ncbi:transcription factor FER-LIKE IRON DEFICIENCY-INDUCED TRANSCRIPTION FACTOR [Dorcoceras hygrometricum]|uniref:Transcription factor FER-LIKE IRON DEFICIENCY-INDUCED TRANSCRIPTION FACTOR n=1 Tax=Dorcoceras hygrometricum TaxID=472368 RepID=A0A2Z7AXP5_9LAMI|nr:transcription factor FER-LIKE IRON DEFICIENCY-INDUCED TRANSCRIPTION FACTOR [Dorcoceras hygrometricum]
MDKNHYGSETFPFEDRNDFGLKDFMDEAIFDQFINLIRGENATDSSINSSIFGYLFSPEPPVELFDFDISINHIDSNKNNNNTNALNKLAEEDVEAEAEDIFDGEESSATATATSAKEKGNKVDRSRTLISERKRRGRMKEKLYALRSLVPNITKMDKASIVGDAVLYLQDLQMQLKKLKSEISDLESSFTTQDNLYQQKTFQDSKKMDAKNFYPMVKKISKINVCQVEERGFYVKIVSNKDEGVAVLLYRALELLPAFHVQSSNLAAFAHNYVLTFTIHIQEGELGMNLPDLKLWIAGTFLEQGFDFETSAFDSPEF